MSLQYNDAAERLLSGHGFDCEPEPEWVSGRVPVFYCAGRATLCVEVKSLDEPDEMKMTGNASDRLRARAHTVRNRGRVLVYVADDMSDRDVKLAFVIADRALDQMAVGGPRPHRVFVVIPRDPEYGRRVRIFALLRA